MEQKVTPRLRPLENKGFRNRFFDLIRLATLYQLDKTLIGTRNKTAYQGFQPSSAKEGLIGTES